MTTLAEYIRSKGVAQCAAEWGATERAVESWLYGDRQPRIKTATDIMRISGLSMEEIYGVVRRQVPRKR